MARRRGRWASVAMLAGAGALLSVTGVDGDPLGRAPAVLAVPTASGDDVDAAAHLRQIMARSPAPEYRRFGAPGVDATAAYLAEALAAAGYDVERAGVEHRSERWVVDYAPGHEPALTIDGVNRPFAVESGFGRQGGDPSTGPDGVTCVVVPYDVATAGDCGLVPFEDASPEWNNVTAAATSELIASAAERGVAGLVFQGVPERDLIFAQQVRSDLPVVTAAVADDEILGRRVHLRTVGHWEEAVIRNVAGVLPPADPAAGYVVVTAHIDAWFGGAVDNAAGSAAVIDAAEALARHHRGGDLDLGVLVLFFDAEEVGLVGSARVAADLASDAGLDVAGTVVRMDDLIGNVNLDAPSAKPSDVHGHDHGAALLGPFAEHGLPVFSWRALVFSDPAPATSDDPYRSAATGLEMASVFAAHDVFGLPAPASAWAEISGGWRTDAQHFAEAGVPVVWPVAGYPEYHTNRDEFDPDDPAYDAVDPDDLQHVADATVHWVSRLDG